MAVNKKKVLKTLQANLKSAEPFYDEWKNKRSVWIKEFDGEPYGNEDPDGNKASVVSRDIKKAAEWQRANLVEPFVSSSNMVKTSPVTFEDKLASEQSETVLNYQWCREFKRYNFTSDSIKVLQREGTVIARVGWEFQEAEVEVEVPVMTEVLVPGPQGLVYQEVPTGEMTTEIQTKTVVNRPTAEVCDNNMVYIAPNCKGDIEVADFVIYKYKTNMSTLKQNEDLYDNVDKIEIKDSASDDTDITYTDTKDTTFKYSDEPRKEIEVVEYWGNYDMNDDGIAEAIVCVWVGNTIIRLEENPYPDQKVPFVSCGYDSDPFSVMGKPNADLLSNKQKIKTGIERAFLDTINSSTNGQKGIPKGALDPINLKKFREGKDFEFNGEAKAIWEGHFNDIPNSTMNFYQTQSAEIESLSGIKAFNSGIGGSSLGDSATAARGIMDATAKREVDIARNFKENYILPILRKWHAMNGEFLEEETVVRITNEEFVPIRRDDLDGNIDIDIDIATAETDANKSSELSFMLQTMAQSLPFDLTKILLAEQAELKKMPSLAKKIKEYQPQPDPLDQEMKMLEVEKLKAEIAERQSRAAENQVDIRAKNAKAALDEAKARDIHSGADMKDQEFLDKETGVARERELEDKLLDHESKKALSSKSI